MFIQNKLPTVQPAGEIHILYMTWWATALLVSPKPNQLLNCVTKEYIYIYNL